MEERGSTGEEHRRGRGARGKQGKNTEVEEQGGRRGLGEQSKSKRSEG